MIFRNKWKILKTDCTPLIQRGTPINIEKISSLLIILFCGFLCALITLIIEKRFQPAFQSEHFSHGSTLITSKYKMKILITEVIEDTKIADVTNSSLNSKLQDILDFNNKCHCCTCKCKCI